MTCNEIIKGIWATREIWVGCTKLDPKDSWPFDEESRNEFRWGEGNAGLTRLLFAILLELAGPHFATYAIHGDSGIELFGKLPQGDFIFTRAEVESWIALRALRRLNG